MLIAAKNVSVTMIHLICSKIKRGESGLQMISIYIPLHKKSSKMEYSNYRRISLISHASKVLLNIIYEQIKVYIFPQILSEQASFVLRRGIREEILNTRQIIEKARELTNWYIYVSLTMRKPLTTSNGNYFGKI